MSEVNNAAAEAREPVSINVDPIDFKPDDEGKYLTSDELCELTSAIFRDIFEDYRGCTFEVVNGMPSMSLHFRHIDEKSGDKLMGVERASAKTSGVSVIDKTRSRDQRIADGDRYYITDDACDVIKEYLFPRVFNNGKVNWKNITTEVADTTQQSMYAPVRTLPLTKVTAIDPKRICAIIWGKGDNTGMLDYGVDIKADLSVMNPMGMPIPMAMAHKNYLLHIVKAHTETVKETYQKLGIGTFGSNII